MTMADDFAEKYRDDDAPKQWDAIDEWKEEGKITNQYPQFDIDVIFTVCGLTISGLKSDEIPSSMKDDYSDSGVVYGFDTAHVGLLDTPLDLNGMDWVADKIADQYKIFVDGDTEIGYPDPTDIIFSACEAITVEGDPRGNVATWPIYITSSEAKELAEKAGLNDFAELCDLFPDKKFTMQVQYDISENIDIEFSDGSWLSDDGYITVNCVTVK